MIIVNSLGRLAERIAQARRSARTNPPRPAELQSIYDQLDQWSGKDMTWLTENAKMDKAVRGQRWLVRGISFMSANVAKQVVRLDPTKWGLTASDVEQLRNVCPGATAGCMAVCLVDAGQMGLPAAKSAQLRRQLAFTYRRDAFFTMVIIAIAQMLRTARKQRRKLGIRLNVTSDLDWENIAVQVDPWLAAYLRTKGVDVRAGQHTSICSVFPMVTFYDYTKVLPRMERFLAHQGWPSNYHLTWSLAETPLNRLMAIKVLSSKAASCSVPFDIPSTRNHKNDPLPKTLTIIDNTPGQAETAYTFPVINADEHDLRFLDQFGAIAGLHFKLPKKAALKGTNAAAKMAAGGAFVVATGGSDNPSIRVFRARETSMPSVTNPPPKGQRFDAMRDVMLEIIRRRQLAPTSRIARAKTNPDFEIRAVGHNRRMSRHVLWQGPAPDAMRALQLARRTTPALAALRPGTVTVVRSNPCRRRHRRLAGMRA